jgi:hypothetical protein
VQFPICSTRPKFVEQRNRRLKLVGRSARSHIERFQPYHSRNYPEARWLATVREIDDMDKHRLLVFTDVFVKHITINASGSEAVRGFKAYKGRMKVGSVLASFKPSNGKSGDKVKLNLVVIPVFGQSTPKELVGLSAVNCLIHARNFILKKMLPAFQALN